MFPLPRSCYPLPISHVLILIYIHLIAIIFETLRWLKLIFTDKPAKIIYSLALLLSLVDHPLLILLSLLPLLLLTVLRSSNIARI